MHQHSQPSGGPRKRVAVWLLAGALAVGAAGCGGDDDGDEMGSVPSSTQNEPIESGPATGDQVEIKTFIFRQNPLTVEPGTTVTWTNDDEILHTVSDGERDMLTGRFDGQLDGKGSTFEATYDESGTFAYHCTIHPGMDGVVIVK